jgi:hypothetical protein
MVNKKLKADSYCITSYRVSLASRVVVYVSERMLPVMLFLYSGCDTGYELLVPLSFVGMQTGQSDC